MKSFDHYFIFQILLPEKETLHLDPILDLHITRIETNSFSWTIPCFPVMTVDFVKVAAEVKGRAISALVRNDTAISVGNVRCTSHCNTTIKNEVFTVLWEFASGVPQSADVRPPHSEPPQSAPLHSALPANEGTVDMNTTHTLPFKVLGTCYSKDRQKVLEQALELLENNRSVYVDLQHEPDNPYDDNAVAVFLQTDIECELVGYIARELTKYVRPYLTDPGFHADVKSIRFRTIYMMVGFYLTIEITKKRLWHKDVVKASKTVR